MNTDKFEMKLPRWNVRKLNGDKLSAYITSIKNRNDRNHVENIDAENSAKTVTGILTGACNVSMPKVRLYRNKRPVYWWNNEIRELRAKCLSARRASTRNHNNELLAMEFKKWRKILRRAIKDSKKRTWAELCMEIDSDPWGKPYKIAMKKFGGFKPIPGIKETNWAATIVRTLFPFDEDGLLTTPKSQVDNYIPVNVDDIEHAGKKLSVGKSPGPDGVPNEVIKIMIELWPESLVTLFDLCLKNGTFPSRWKMQKLVLLRKGNKPLTEPSTYRPLCMLDSLGKLFECVILKRLEERIADLGGLSSKQYGFRKGKSTVDAIGEVCDRAIQAKTSGEYCAIITLDVKNAFNTVKWKVVLDAFRSKGVDGYLYNIVVDYLSNRILLYETESGMKKYRITAGVPQGSVLGPFLWNVMYDGLLNLKLPDGARLIGYADDIALVIEQRTAELTEIVANDSLCRCNRWLWRNGLQLAVAKTESILVTDRRTFEIPRILLQGSEIPFKRDLCYLGVQLDRNLNFKQHVLQIRDKAMRTANLLARIMPNCGGAKPQIRRLINSVVHSQLLYAAPTFARALKLKNNTVELLKPQRISALRITSAYRTVSTSAALVLAGLPPIDLLIMEAAEIYSQSKCLNIENFSPMEQRRQISEIKNKARENTLEKWQERWSQEDSGRWTYRLIPNIRPWIERSHGNLSYYMTQVMTNHGSFNSYLCRFKLRPTGICDACGALEDDARHIIFECEKWQEERHYLNDTLGVTLTPDNMVNVMLQTASAWKLCESFINRIMKLRCSAIPNLLN